MKLISIGLNADNPKLYNDIMKPTGGAAFGDVCSFVIACVEVGESIVVFCILYCLLTLFGCQQEWASLARQWSDQESTRRMFEIWLTHSELLTSKHIRIIHERM